MARVDELLPVSGSESAFSLLPQVLELCSGAGYGDECFLSCCSTPPPVTEFQLLSEAEVRVVHVTPSARTSAAVHVSSATTAAVIDTAVKRPKRDMRDRTSNQDTLEKLEFIFHFK
jgi:hypothetical protein